MGTYIARRLLLMIPTLIGITFLVFMIVALAPGGIGAALTVQGGAMQSQKSVAVLKAYLDDRYGLDDPAPVQYLRWLERISPIKFGTRDLVSPSGVKIRPPKRLKEPPLWQWFAPKLPEAGGPAIAGSASDTREARVAAFETADRRYADARSASIASSTLLSQALGDYARRAGFPGGADAEGRGRPAALRRHRPAPDSPDWARLRPLGEQALADYAGATQRREDLIAAYAARPYRRAGFPVIPGLVSVSMPDFGVTFTGSRPVLELIKTRLPVTLMINLIAFPIIYLVAIPGGMLAAAERGKALDLGLGALFIGLWSIPTVLAGVLALGFLASPDYLGGFPVSGLHDTAAEFMPFLPREGPGGVWTRGYLLDTVWHLCLPVMCLVYTGFAVLSKQCRAAMLDNFSADYVRTARAKGVPGRDIVLRHVFRNSLLPLITMFVTIFPAMLAGSVIVEKVFTVPGMGSLILESIQLRDRELLLANTLMIAAVNLSALLLADILYAMADPRVTYS